MDSTASQWDEVDLEEANRSSAALIYSQLPTGVIRTLRIIPAGDGSLDTLECILSETPLVTPSSYKALSYAWGSKANPATIALNGETYFVTQNLLGALQHLRAIGFKSELWIDALCINQGDIPERNRQLQLMPQIYKNADRVLLWLGPDEDYSDTVLDTISEGLTVEFNAEWVETLYSRSENRGRDTIFHHTMDLLVRDYWNRLWVVQEIAYARDVVLCCGFRQLPFSGLIKFIEALKARGMSWRTAQSGIGRIVLMYMGAVGPAGLKAAGSARNTDQFEDPAWMLARNATTKQCRDPRDRIYGCFGLFSPQLRSRISVDYSKGPADVILEATTAIIESTRRLEIILLKRRSDNGPELEPWQEALPSWAPELDDKFGQREVFFEEINPKLQGSACGEEEASCRFVDNGRVLTTTAVLIGRITEIQIRRYPTSEHMYGREREHVELVKAIFIFQQHLADRIQSKPEEVAFWTTIFGSYFQTHKVLDTPLGQVSGSEALQQSDGTSNPVIQFALQLHQMAMSVADREGLGGMLKSIFRIPVFTGLQTRVIESLYRHFDHRALFTFQRILPNSNPTPRMVDGEALRPLDFGVCPTAAQENDLVCVLYGCRVPVILRPSGPSFQVIGHADVCGFMNGEALNGLEAGCADPEEIRLI